MQALVCLASLEALRVLCLSRKELFNVDYFKVDPKFWKTPTQIPTSECSAAVLGSPAKGITDFSLLTL